MRNEIIRKTRHYLQLAKQLGYSVPDVTVKFDLTGTTAGQARWQTVCGEKKYSLRFNLQACQKDPDHILSQTVPHEVAHVLQYVNFPSKMIRSGRRWVRSVRPHGREWKNIMLRLGVTPQRCHNIPLEKSRKVEKKFRYECSCQVFMLTSIRHNRNNDSLLRTGKSHYHCKKCGRDLVFSP